MIEAREKIEPVLEANGKITIGEVRDLIGTSRKNVKILLEYFDNIKLTKKNGTETEREAVKKTV